MFWLSEGQKGKPYSFCIIYTVRGLSVVYNLCCNSASLISFPNISFTRTVQDCGETQCRAFCVKATKDSLFHSNYSTRTALIKIIDDLQFNLDNDCVGGMKFSRLSQSIWHDWLWPLAKETWGIWERFDWDSLQCFTSYLNTGNPGSLCVSHNITRVNIESLEMKIC